jgi:uncharacterized protein with von Willebrand factor type A (vWA) domain
MSDIIRAVAASESATWWQDIEVPRLQKPVSIDAVVCDSIDGRRWDLVLKHAPDLSGSVGKIAAEYPTFTELAKAAFHSLDQSDPQLEDAGRLLPRYRVHRAVMAEVMGLKEWVALRRSTVGDLYYAALGTGALVEELREIYQRLYTEDERCRQQEMEDLGNQLEDLSQALHQILETAPEGSPQDQPTLEQQARALAQQMQQIMQQLADLEAEQEEAAEDEGRAIRAAGRAASTNASEQIEEVQEAEELAEAIGFDGGQPGGSGWSPFGHGGKVDSGPFDQQLRIAEMVKQHRILMEVAKVLGRLERRARSARGKKKVHGMDEVSDTTLGRDISRQTSSEMARMADPNQNLLWAADFSEGKLLNVEMDEEAAHEQGGPAMIARDTSGSTFSPIDTVAGQPISATAVFGAITLAMKATVVNEDRRPLLVLPFSGEHRPEDVPVYELDPDAPGGIDPNVVLQAITHTQGGGTNYTGWMKRVIRELTAENEKPWRNADLLVLTDGLCSIPSDTLEDFLAAKREHDLRVVTVLVGQPANNADGTLTPAGTLLFSFSDVLLEMNSLADADKVVDAAFGA